MRLSLHATGPVDPRIAWERYADLDQWPTWSPQLVRVDTVERRLRAGLEGHVVGPLGVRLAFTVTALVDRSWSWDVRLPLGQVMHLDHDVRPHGSGTITGLRVDGPLPLVIGYSPLAQLALHQLVRT